MKKNIILVFSILLLFPVLYGQTDVKEAAALKIAESINVDGLADEAAWDNAPEIGEFIQFQPPFGFIQLAYQKGTALFGERGNQGHTLFIKLAYMF